MKYTPPYSRCTRIFFSGILCKESMPMLMRFFKWRRFRQSALFAFFSYTALALSAVCVGGMWVWVTHIVRELGPVIVPLHRTVYYGIDYLGTPSLLFFLPAFGTLIFALHAGLGIFLFKKEKFFAYCLWSSTLILELFLGLGALSIIRNL